MFPMPAKSAGFLVSRTAPRSAATEASIRSIRRGRGLHPDLRTDAAICSVEVRGTGGVGDRVEIIEHFAVPGLASGHDERVVVIDAIGQFGDGERADGDGLG